MTLKDPESGCRRGARCWRDNLELQQTVSVEASGGDGNLIGLWTKARVEKWRGSADREWKRVESTDPRASGQGARASSLQQQPEQIIRRRRPQRQLHKNILGALGRCATQGPGTWRWKPNFVLGKVVRVAWCEATKWAASPGNSPCMLGPSSAEQRRMVREVARRVI